MRITVVIFFQKHVSLGYYIWNFDLGAIHGELEQSFGLESKIMEHRILNTRFQPYIGDSSVIDEGPVHVKAPFGIILESSHSHDAMRSFLMACSCEERMRMSISSCAKGLVPLQRIARALTRTNGWFWRSKMASVWSRYPVQIGTSALTDSASISSTLQGTGKDSGTAMDASETRWNSEPMWCSTLIG